MDEMMAQGFGAVEWRIVERTRQCWYGRQVMSDPFLQKHASSQLALLSDAAYAAGLARIEAALRQAEASGEALAFPARSTFAMLTGCWLGAFN